MKRKHYKFPLTVWIFLLFIFFVPKTSAAYQPPWLQGYIDGTFELPSYYYSVGFAPFEGDSPHYEIRRLAKDRAFYELCYRLWLSHLSQIEKNPSQVEHLSNEYFAFDIFLAIQNGLSGIRSENKWTDIDNHLYWELIVIDKNKADYQIEQEIQMQSDIERGVILSELPDYITAYKKIESIINRNMQVYPQRMKNYGELLKTIDRKIAAVGKQTKKEFENIRKEILKVIELWEHQKAMLDDQNRIKNFKELNNRKRNKELMTLIKKDITLQNQFVKTLSILKNDLFLALLYDDIKLQSENSGEFRVSIAPEKGQGANYYNGENLRFLISATNDCFVKVIYLSSIGDDAASEIRMNTMLFPNVHDRDNFIKAGRPKIIGKTRELVVQPPYGKDIITVVASQHQFTDIEESLRQAAKSGRYYQRITRNISAAVHSRRIGVAPSGILKTSSAKDSFVSDTCFISTQHQ